MSLLAIRHGETDDNAKGIPHAWSNDHLNARGTQAIGALADEMQPIKGRVAPTVLTSDLPRAVESARPIASALGAKVAPTPTLRTFNQDRESKDRFVRRVAPVLRRMVESPHVHVALTHNKVLGVLDAMAQAHGEVTGDTMKTQGPVGPAGAVLVSPDWRLAVVHPGQAEPQRGS